MRDIIFPAIQKTKGSEKPITMSMVSELIQKIKAEAHAEAKAQDERDQHMHRLRIAFEAAERVNTKKKMPERWIDVYEELIQNEENPDSVKLFLELVGVKGKILS